MRFSWVVALIFGLSLFTTINFLSADIEQKATEISRLQGLVQTVGITFWCDGHRIGGNTVYWPCTPRIGDKVVLPTGNRYRVIDVVWELRATTSSVAIGLTRIDNRIY